MLESSNKFNLKPELRHVIAPEAPTGYVPSPEDNDKTPNKKNSLRNRLIGAGVVATLAISGGIIGINAAKSGEKPAEVPSTSAPLEEEPVAPVEEEPIVERYEGTDFTQTTELPANLEYLNDMTAEEFAKQPISDKIAWASWVDQYRGEFATYFQSVTGDPTDALLTPVDGNLTALLSDRQYQYRIAANLGSGTPRDIDTNGQLDRLTAEKYLLAFNLNDNAIFEISRTFDNLNSDGQALNVVSIARGGLSSLVEGSQEATDLEVIETTVLKDGVSYKATAFKFTALDTGEVNRGRYAVIDGRTVLL
ncbi:hypothetical protein H7200_00005 [Candidatus Saccharibacteria bacterium]|nr:hypothetical protein [Candidatus Saccharibacteria bacterium]